VPGLVLVFEDDLLFAARVENGLRAIGFHARFVASANRVGEALKALPVLILVNIGSRTVPWPRLVQLVKDRRSFLPAPVVGYGPHVDLELRQEALDSGCDAVVGRSAVANGLDSLLGRYAWMPDRSVCNQPVPAGVLKGIEQFNSHAFYRCHDSIEAVWVAEQGDVRFMYQGLLQISVGFYHIQHNNLRGAAKIMARGKGKLLPFLPGCQGIDLRGLLDGVESCEDALREPDARGIAGEDWFPTIQLTR
jgi:hypothetical protein